MSTSFQNMDPNSEKGLDDDHTKFRARFERLSTFSLGYNPSLLQASPASSTVSRSPLKPVKIRTDWSRPDVDDDGDSELNSSGIFKFSLDNLDDSQISNVDSPMRVLDHLDLGNSPPLSSVNVAVNLAPSSHLAITSCNSDDLRRENGSRFFDILNSSSENDSDMELSSSCGVILLERPEGEADQAQNSSDTGTVLGESDEIERYEIISQGMESAALDSKEFLENSQSSMQVESDGNDIGTLLVDAEDEEVKIAVSEKVLDDGLKKSESSPQCHKETTISESDPENAVDLVNLTPIKKSVISRSVEGTPARVLFPENTRSAEGTPVNTHSLIARDASVSSSLHIEGTPSRRHRAIDQVQSEVPDLVSRLNSKYDDWIRRIDALKRISRFTTFHMSPSALAEACLPLLDPIALQLQDLRSQIVKQACVTIGDLSECLGFQFHVYARYLFPRLLDLLRIAKKVMSSASDECLRRIITHSHVDAIEIIIQESGGNKSPIVRCRCVEYISLALQAWNVIQLASYKSSIGSLFSKICSDSTKDVRTAGKRLFIEFARTWPVDSRDVFKVFDQKLQKTILADHPQLQDVVAFFDEQFIKADSDHFEKTPMRLSLAEVKAKIRRESVASSSTDVEIIIVEKASTVACCPTFPISSSEPPKAPILCGLTQEVSSPVAASVTNFKKLVMLPPRSPSLSFKFDQSHPSIQHERDRLVPTLSPIPSEFLEGFPMPAPLRTSIPPEARPKMPEPSPLVKHSSRKFTSRVVGTPVNGKFDDADNDDDSSSTASSCPTVEQSFDEADENGQISVSSSLAAESVDVLAREVAAYEYSEPEELDRRREKMMILESKLQYLRTMATSVFDEGESPVRTIEIHHDLTSAATAVVGDHEQIKENIIPIAEMDFKEQSVLSPPRSELKCDSVLKVGCYSFEASKSPKDVLTAVLSTPSSDRVFKSPDNSPLPTSNLVNLPGLNHRKDSEDGSILRSILFIVLSMIIFAFLFHGLPAFLRPGPDDLVSKSKLHYSTADPSIGPPSESPQRIDIPIRDSAQLSDQSSGYYEHAIDPAEINYPDDLNDRHNEDSGAEACHQGHPGADSRLNDIIDDSVVELSQSNKHDDFPKSGTISEAVFSQEVAVAHNETVEQPLSSQIVTAVDDEVEFERVFKLEIVKPFDFQDNATNEAAEVLQESDHVFEDKPVMNSLEDLDVVDEGETESPNLQSDGYADTGSLLTPKLAWLYSLIVAALCWITYRIRTVPLRARPLDRDPDFDLTGVTMAPEWDINLDSVLPSGPSPLPHPGGTDYQKWNHIKKDGTSMTLFSPLRRTLRIRRPRRPTQF